MKKLFFIFLVVIFCANFFILTKVDAQENYCPSGKFCISNAETGKCPPPDPANNRYCCCKMETLEELDARIETNPDEVDEPFGFIQKCRCKCFTTPCTNDEECMKFPMDPYEREVDHYVCGGTPQTLSPQEISYQPKVEISQPSLGSYQWEVGLPFFAKKEQVSYFFKESNALKELLIKTIRWIFNFIGIIMFFVIVYAGILYSTSSGNPQKQKEAQQRIIYALIGFIIAICFYIILNTINPDILKV
ncbi:MAG: pilin [Candidatus Paceibacterota bacterium]